MADQTENQDETWLEATERFIESASDLGALYAPQIKTLRSLAKRLDAPGDTSAALEAEYSRVHRWLVNKLGGSKGGDGDGLGPSLGEMLPGLAMFG